MVDGRRDRESRMRPLDLGPPGGNVAAKSHYAIVDIGSNSVRIVVYDQLGRAPLPA